MGNISDVQRGGQLKTLRESAGLSQGRVAAHFKIDKSAVSEWERGLSKPTLNKLKPLDKLYGGDGKVLALFEVGAVSARRSGDSTVETLRSEVTRLAEVVGRLSDEVAELRARDGPPSSSRAR